MKKSTPIESCHLISAGDKVHLPAENRTNKCMLVDALKLDRSIAEKTVPFVTELTTILNLKPFILSIFLRSDLKSL